MAELIARSSTRDRAGPDRSWDPNALQFGIWPIVEQERAHRQEGVRGRSMQTGEPGDQGTKRHPKRCMQDFSYAAPQAKSVKLRVLPDKAKSPTAAGP